MYAYLANGDSSERAVHTPFEASNTVLPVAPRGPVEFRNVTDRVMLEIVDVSHSAKPLKREDLELQQSDKAGPKDQRS